MDTQVCIICKQPILGYWHELGKNNIICQSCAAVTTVYDLFQRGIIDIKPDIIDAESAVYVDTDSLVTKGGEEEFPFDDGYHYTDEDIAEFGKIISEIKGRGFNSEHEFSDECRRLMEEGVEKKENYLLVLWERYTEMAPAPRYEGDEGNDTWGTMYAQWKTASPYFQFNPDTIGTEVKVTIGS